MNDYIMLYALFDVTVVNPIPDYMLFSGILVVIFGIFVIFELFFLSISILPVSLKFSNAGYFIIAIGSCYTP